VAHHLQPAVLNLGSQLNILYTLAGLHLLYSSLDESRWVMAGRGAKQVENHWSKHNGTKCVCVELWVNISTSNGQTSVASFTDFNLNRRKPDLDNKTTCDAWI